MLSYTDYKTKADAIIAKEEISDEIKQSGFGRDLSILSFDKYTALKIVWVKY